MILVIKKTSAFEFILSAFRYALTQRENDFPLVVSSAILQNKSVLRKEQKKQLAEEAREYIRMNGCSETWQEFAEALEK